MRYLHIAIIILFITACQHTRKDPEDKIQSRDSTELKCCSSNIPERFSTLQQKESISIIEEQTIEGMVWIPGGRFMMGGDDQWARTDEQPLHEVTLDGFYLDQAPVTNDDFALFIEATGYKTTAQKKPDWEIIKTQLPPGTPKPHDSILQPSSLVFTPPSHPVGLNNHLVWWSWVNGADWKHPQGPNSDLNGLEKHPVVHVSWEDAQAYAKWVGKRLPTEAEFEYASRGGQKRNLYPWGNERIHIGPTKANSWEGEFPIENTYNDGFYTTSPVKNYPANAYGLYDIAGNVWEWCSDWYHSKYYEQVINGINNPKGPEQSFDPNDKLVKKRVVRGGSYLCNDSYCSGFRSAARMKNDPYSSQSHVGFRCAKSK